MKHQIAGRRDFLKKAAVSLGMVGASGVKGLANVNDDLIAPLGSGKPHLKITGYEVNRVKAMTVEDLFEESTLALSKM